ncbi:MAG TPA: serine/threonine protein kinase [Gammaproteobacteria bacterium]|nr:serine/threonine protein kinase [Gammaproteobacteria bacterium]
MDDDNAAHSPGNDDATPYARLTPDTVLDAVAGLGMVPSGHLLALNSYENRVYQIGIDDATAGGAFVVAKFYRPQRWSDATILEEHAFALELAAQEIPIVPPLALSPPGSTAPTTLHNHAGYRFALFERRGGRAPELTQPEHLQWLGRFLARMHQVGGAQRFAHRPRLTTQRLGHDSLAFLRQCGLVSPEVENNYFDAAERVMEAVENQFEACGPQREIRLHGDCHPGNILWTDAGPHFVDLDDCMQGPAIQDLWMLLSGDRTHMEGQLRELMHGYRDFADFDPLELHLVESLRALRLIHYSAWLARRWHDPAFPQHFPWFNTPRYWEDQMVTLREQLERLQQAPLSLES